MLEVGNKILVGGENTKSNVQPLVDCTIYTKPIKPRKLQSHPLEQGRVQYNAPARRVTRRKRRQVK